MKRIAILVVIAAALAAGWTYYWHRSAGELDAGVQVWVRERRAEGYQVAYETAKVTGYPTHLSLDITNPVIVTPSGQRWEGPEITGQAAVWSPFTLDLDFSGHHLVSNDSALLPVYHEIEIDDGKGAFALDQYGFIESGGVTAREITITDNAGRVTKLALFEGTGGPARQGAAEHLPELDFEGRILDLTLPEGLAETERYGRRIDHVFVEGVLVGEIPPVPLETALPYWRERGGYLIIKDMDFLWGPITLDGDGRVALDGYNRPEADLDLEVAGLPEIVSDLEEDGQIAPAGAALLRLGVIALSSRKDENGRPIAALPVTIINGQLSLGPLPLGQVPPLF